MIRKDLHNNIDARRSLSPVAIATNTTTAGQIIDTQSFGALEFVLQTATLTDGTYTPLLQEATISDMSDAQTVDASNLIGTIAGATFTVGDGNKVKRIGVVLGRYRYVRLSIVSTVVTVGATIAATAILANPDILPVP